jgi:hypothetical protein
MTIREDAELVLANCNEGSAAERLANAWLFDHPVDADIPLTDEWFKEKMWDRSSSGGRICWSVRVPPIHDEADDILIKVEHFDQRWWVSLVQGDDVIALTTGSYRTRGDIGKLIVAIRPM